MTARRAEGRVAAPTSQAAHRGQCGLDEQLREQAAAGDDERADQHRDQDRPRRRDRRAPVRSMNIARATLR